MKKKVDENGFTAKSGKDFLDMIAPSTVKFYTDYFICGNTFRCVWALREYPTSTSEQAILRYLGEKEGVTLHIYARHVTPAEEKRIISNAANKNRMQRNSTNDLQQTVAAESNLQDVAQLVAEMHRSREPLLHTAVYIEMTALSLEALRNMQTEVQTELVRSKLNVDRLMLRQQAGFNSIKPGGWNVFREQFERVLPASSTANLYPFSFSGKTDEHGCYLGRDKFGSNIIVDFDKRSDDKTNANMLILCLDPELEYAELTKNLGGCFIDLMSGEYIINVLEPKTWDVGVEEDEIAPKAFRGKTRLSQHISFLRDFFRCYKDFSDREIDTIELMLIKLYERFGISDRTDFSKLKRKDYPVLSDLYAIAEEEFRSYNEDKNNIYTAETLQNICLGLHSMCRGAESKFFNGHTNITDGSFVTFGVKGLLQASRNIRSALLFNVLSYMSNELLTAGNTVASVDEFYLFLSNPVAVEYIRNFMKRVRKKNSAVILASQNLEDFNLEGIRELTKPLFAIPTHQFLFHAGTVDKDFYIDNLQLELSEYELTRYSQRGVCLYKCGNERYCLCVHAPEYKERLFGSAGGR